MLTKHQETALLNHPKNGKGVEVRISKYLQSPLNSFFGREGKIVNIKSRHGKITHVAIRLYSVGYGSGIMTFPIEHVTPIGSLRADNSCYDPSSIEIAPETYRDYDECSELSDYPDEMDFDEE